ncbi:MAG: hypothetical protein JSW26_16675, partial [Desulfobacterales bacterium]
MRKTQLIIIMALCSLIILSVINVPTADCQSKKPMLKIVFIDVDSPGTVAKLARMGIDIAAVRNIDAAKVEKNSLTKKYRIEAVVSAIDETKLKKAGIKWTSAQSAAAAQAMTTATAKQAADSVYHSFDEPNLGIKDQLHQIAAQYPRIAHLTTIGYSTQNRPLLAMSLSSKFSRKKHGRWHWKKPEVLILATHHAREWVATQMAMRLIKYLASNFGSDSRVTNLLNNVKVWIIPVANPDGYE